MHLLQPCGEHGAVDFDEDVFAHVDAEVGVDADDVGVYGLLIELTVFNAVGNDGFAVGIAVGDDVCGFEQLLVFEPAHGALCAIGREDTLAEGALMQAHANVACYIAAQYLVACLVAALS